MPKDAPNEIDSSIGQEILWHGVLPLRLLSQRIRLDMMITSHAESPICLTGWRRTLTLAVLQGLSLLILFLLFAGAFLLLYLMKKALGIDLFANFHLF